MYAQNIGKEDNTYIANTISLYRQSVGDQSAIYNGGFYYQFPKHIHNGHPFFKNTSPVNGTVWYDGQEFNSVPLLYDEINDQLITISYNRKQLLQLVKQKVDSFKIQEHVFVNMFNDQENIKQGYYEVLLSGKSLVLKKEIKIIKERIVSQFDVNRTAETQTRFFVRVNENFKEITSSRSLLSLLGAHQKEVASNLRAKKIRFKANREMFIVEAISVYDQLAR